MLAHGCEAAIFLTPFNKAVWTFANLQARNVALKNGKQLFWIKNKDTPPASWREYFTDDQVLDKDSRISCNLNVLLAIF